MPRYEVVEKRSYEATVIIDAVDEAAACRYDGDIVDEWEDSNFNSVGEEILSVKQMADDYEARIS